jgi:regulator of sigma E protease
MSPDFFSSLLGTFWSILLIIVFLGGSIFVHELGHFLAARRRGLKVERFSIGFGPAIWKRRGQDGVEYRLSCLPFGGYVALPQLADLSAIEGKSETDPETLPPTSYATRMIVLVAGATFNMLFAFALACVVWVVGQPAISDLATTRIGFLSPNIRLTDGTTVPNPAIEAGLKMGDRIISIDGRPVANFEDIMTDIFLGHDRESDGRRKCLVAVERNGQKLDFTVYPRLVSDENVRSAGLEPAEDLTVETVLAGSPAQAAGILPGDSIIAVDDRRVFQRGAVSGYLAQNATRAVGFLIRRNGAELKIPIQPRMETDEGTHRQIPRVGIRYRDNVIYLHPTPWSQISENVVRTFQTLGALLNSHSDIGPSKLSGPIGMARELQRQAQWDFRAVLSFTILINVSLAVLNLLPIPVLDGGQMLFATIGRLRGRALPVNFVAATQSVFMVLILSLMLYVTIFGDLRRLVRDSKSETQAKEAVPEHKKSAEPPVPARP